MAINNNHTEGALGSDVDEIIKSGNKKDGAANKIYPATDCEDKNNHSQRMGIGPMSEDEQIVTDKKIGQFGQKTKKGDDDQVIDSAMQIRDVGSFDS